MQFMRMRIVFNKSILFAHLVGDFIIYICIIIISFFVVPNLWRLAHTLTTLQKLIFLTQYFLLFSITNIQTFGN